MSSIFLDANIIADWMIVKLSLKGLNPISKQITLRKFKEKILRAYHSYKIIEFVRKNTSNYSFYTSDLAIMEVVSVIFEKYVIDDMVLNGISLKYFGKYRDEIKLPSDACLKIHYEIFNFRKLFVDNNKINLVNDMSYHVCKYVIMKYNLRTPDAFLISQANKCECKRFISNDDKLSQMLKKYKKVNIVKPKAFYNELVSKKLT